QFLIVFPRSRRKIRPEPRASINLGRWLHWRKGGRFRMQSFAQRQGHSYAGLEIIRGLAAATVVWCHVFLYRLAPPSEIAQLPGQYATEAVICFFVLSGAVVTLSSPTAPSPRQNFKAYMLARALRIYPVYVWALALSLLAAFATGARIAPIQYFAHLAFLQSMTGWPAPPLEQDYALWSLANEVLYYGLFAVSFFLRHFMLIWTGGTLILTLLIYPFAHDSSNGLVAYVCFMGTLSAPWLIGHWLVVLRASLPRVPVSLGLAICAIGLASPAAMSPVAITTRSVSISLPPAPARSCSRSSRDRRRPRAAFL